MASPLAARWVAGVAWRQRSAIPWMLGLAFGTPLIVMLLILSVVVGAIASVIGTTTTGGGVSAYYPSAFAIKDIPAAYLRVYQATGARYSLDWTYLAAIGKIETDHGRLKAAGVTSGVNSFGCCAGPMQFSIIGANGGTWGSYGVDANDDGRKDVYDPEDAIPAAASYLKASGAPDDWDAAIFAYNHAAWYVNDVKAMAARYRAQPIATTDAPAGSAQSQTLPPGVRWLEPVPATSARCDRRIVLDVQLILERYRAAAGDCYARSGHANAGEHPLGLAIDLVPGRGGSWALLGQLARDFGWRESCGPTGCAGLVPSPFRFIGWNGYPGHGDPAHAGANAHLHLSWQHTPASPGSPAAIVQTLLPPPSAIPAPLSGKAGTGTGTGSPSPRALLNLGDSLAVGVDDPLAQTLTGWQVRTDASIGRLTNAGVARLRLITSRGSLPPVIAVSLGSNDAPTAARAFAAGVADVLSLAGSARCVLWFSITRPPLQGTSYRALNTVLERAARSHPNLHVLDGAVGDSAPDGVHKTPAGYRQRARQITHAARECS